MDEISQVYAYYEQNLRNIDQIIYSRCIGRVPIIADIMQYLLESGGKRIRPLTTFMCAGISGNSGENAAKLASAIELIHTATLLHDDVIDSSLMRRNKPTVNNNWNNKNSILMGDFLFSQAFELMVETGSNQVLDLLAKTSSIISEGEILQLSISGNIKLTMDDCYKVINAKTAALFSASCAAPTLLSSEGAKLKEDFLKIGTAIGMSFQLQDDILDYYRNEKSSKKLGDDFYEGKVTAPIIILREAASSIEREKIEQIWNYGEFSQNNLDYIITLLNKYNITDHIHSLSKKYLDSADNIITELNINNDHTKNLSMIIDFCATRKN